MFGKENMSDPKSPRLYADDRGVWREDKPGHPFGIEWDEIYRIGGYKLDCVTEIDTVLEIDFEYGEFVELNSTWDGFDSVVETIKSKIEGIDQSRFDQLAASNPADHPVSIWERTTAT